MPWSYDPSLPTSRDKLRLLVQDTDTNDQLLTDEELDFLLTENASNIYRAGSEAARTIAIKLGSRPSVRLAKAGIDADEQFEHYMRLSEKLASSSTSVSGSGFAPQIFAGGISVADIDSRRADTDRPTSGFTTDLHQE